MADKTPKPNETFSAWFDRQGFKHFKAQEFTWMFGRVNKGVKNSEPPRELWSNIIPTVKVLDSLRAKLGKPITLNSTYRAIPYNRSVGSPDGSQHVSFTAIDFTVSGMKPTQVFKELLAMRNRGEWVGGLGKYPSFVHIDTRKNNATW